MSSAVTPVSQKTIIPVSAKTAIQTRHFLLAKVDDIVHCGQYLQQKLTDNKQMDKIIKDLKMWMSWLHKMDLHQNHVKFLFCDVNMHLPSYLHRVTSTPARADLHFHY